MIRAFKREQGLIFKSAYLDFIPDIPSIFDKKYRWSIRQKGSGAQRFLIKVLSIHGLNQDSLNITTKSLSEREAAASITLKKTDIASGTRAVANEFGLGFISLGWQAFVIVIPRNIWFRQLFQSLISSLKSDFGQKIATKLGGYQLNQCGELVWGDD